MNSKTRFLIFYVIILIIECTVSMLPELSKLRFLTKPALVISLLVLFLTVKKNLERHLKKFVSLSLLLSLVGDVLLLMTDRGTFFFIGGLLSFLLAHVMYISAFFKTKFIDFKRLLTITVFLLLYASGVMYLIMDNLGGLMPYVICYIIILLMMVKSMYLRRGFVNKQSYYQVFAGALLFMISDSLLAINMFYKALPFSAILIMSTYGMAQLLIVYGAINQKIMRKNIYDYYDELTKSDKSTTT